MVRPKKYRNFRLTDAEVEHLTTINNTRTTAAQKVKRAKILLLRSKGMSIEGRKSEYKR